MAAIKFVDMAARAIMEQNSQRRFGYFWSDIPDRDRLYRLFQNSRDEDGKR